MPKRRLYPWMVYDIEYVCRVLTPGEPPEAGQLMAYWTGAIDTWGKYTLISVVNLCPYYLFRDEIIRFELPTLE